MVLINAINLLHHLLIQLVYEVFIFFGRAFKQYLLLVLVNQMSSGLFRLMAATGRSMVVANTFGSFAMLVLFALGGFVLSRGRRNNNLKKNGLTI